MIQQISNDITSWWKILRITGGDLALEKCTYSAMIWTQNPYTKQPMIRGIRQEEGSVAAINDEDQRIEITQIPPNKAERQLGLRVSMTGSWKDEIQFRERQILQLSRKIFYAPLTHTEAYLAYRVYLMSMVKYPLHVTTFSLAQCDRLNKIIYKHILPKCGFNRNTPRAIVFAPKTLGGPEFEHIWTTQLILNLKSRNNSETSATYGYGRTKSHMQCKLYASNDRDISSIFVAGTKQMYLC